VPTTPELIDRLVASATPVRRLRPPVLRATAWLLVAGLAVIALAGLPGFRSDLAERLSQPTFTAEAVGPFLTAILSAVATFQLSLPDRSRLWVFLPAPALVLWGAMLAYGCLTSRTGIGTDGVQPGSVVEGLRTLAIASLPPFAIISVMMRHALRLYPTMLTVMGGIASMAAATSALSLLQDPDGAAVFWACPNLGRSP